ncbi:uracil-DNA glycosylase family protein [Komagataeibacter rhaeticus]|nr:uracil-DNA glycosylase family protein [Komagataeibacter rhaeticus]
MDTEITTPAPAPPARPATPRPAAPVVEQAVAAAQAAAQAAGTLAELHAAMRDFSACPLRETATHSVGVEGPQGAPLMLIGEAPDADEDRSGHPFAGKAGHWSGPCSPVSALRGTACCGRPSFPGARPAAAPYEAETRICLPFIQRAIILARPAHVIVMGNLPVSLLLEGGYRGPHAGPVAQPDPARTRPAPTASAPSVPVLAMRHPQQLRASATARRDTWRDMLSIRETLGNMAAKS